MSEFNTNSLTGTLEEWTVVGSSPYQPPENSLQILMGKMYKHATIPDGHEVRTSGIVRINGNIIETNSGSVYKLGEPDPCYVKWCKTTGCHVPTPDEPIKMIKADE